MTLGITILYLIHFLPFEVYSIVADYEFVENASLLSDISKTDWDVWCQLQPNGYNCANYGLNNKYYYDILLQDCKTAPAGVCMHNFNRFETITECHDTCRDYGQHRIPDDLSAKIYCRLQPDFGNCNGYYPRFYYDVTQARCKGFSFSGCGGNRNRFATYQTCSAVCIPIVEYKRDKYKDV